MNKTVLKQHYNELLNKAVDFNRDRLVLQTSDKLNKYIESENYDDTNPTVMINYNADNDQLLVGYWSDFKGDPDVDYTESVKSLLDSSPDIQLSCHLLDNEHFGTQLEYLAKQIHETLLADNDIIVPDIAIYEAFDSLRSDIAEHAKMSPKDQLTILGNPELGIDDLPAY